MFQFNKYWQWGNVSNQEDNSQSKELNADGILDLLNDESEDEGKESSDKSDGIREENENKQDSKGKDDEKEEGESEKEIELKEEELDEDIDIIVPVNKKVIEKEFPGLFKKFPQLEAAYYKSQQYAEVFPSVNDAREAFTKAENLDKFESDILDGNLEVLFRTVKENAPKSLNKIADNLIQTIYKVDESVALHITGNILRNILIKSEKDGIRTKNEDLQTAAKIINAHILGGDEIETPSKLQGNEKENEEESKLNKEREEFEKEKFNSALNSLQGRVDNTIKATIDANIDPKNVMTPYVKKNAIKDASEQVESLINKDKAFQNVLNNLWRSAKDAKYSSPSLERIRSAYLSKAKTVLRDAIRSARNEALKESGKSSNDSEFKDKKGSLPVHRSSTTSNTSKVKEIPKNMSVKDFIMSD
jgi:hypothetical protein